MSLVRNLYRGETNINFVGSRRRWYLASVVLLVICVLSFAFRGFNYGVEFAGGTQFSFTASGTSLTTSSVDSFRRHIDALGPEARRTTVDQVQSAAARNAGDDDAVDPAGDESATEKPSSADDTPEGGSRGT